MEPMKKLKVVAPSLPKRKTKAAQSIEERESQLCALAYDLVEQRLLNGTATSQETTHFLRLGSSRERLEREILQRQKELTEAKTENIRSSAHNDELYSRAIEAMGRYSGNYGSEDEYETYLQ